MEFGKIDETQLQIGSTEAWVWVAVEPHPESSFGSLYLQTQEYVGSRIFS
ncbi:MAG: hypothetical protein WA667_27470 [Candidatus Nitrosopolaris sp.]